MIKFIKYWIFNFGKKQMKSKIFWCKVNKYYLNQWLNFFENQSSHKTNNFENNLIIATCVVTDRAKTKFIKEIKDNYDSAEKIYLTWCAVINKWETKTLQDFLNIYPELEKYKSKIQLLAEAPADSDNINHINKSNLYTKKFLVIQSGCDSYCTFCLTVHKRWKHTNIAEKNIIQEINNFEKSWWKEIVLTWVNLCAWWAKDTNNPSQTQFPSLLKSILKNTQIPRIRISSLWPEFLNDDFFSVINDPRFLPHFHFSIQSFSDNILKSMRRHYNSNQLDYVLKSIKQIQNHNPEIISIWADIITSFPGETKEDFQETLNWIQKYNITKLHAFPFSAHEKWENIPAWLFPNQINNETKKFRQKQIIQIWDNVRKNFISNNIWQEFEILLEEKKWEKWFWRTSNYIKVWIHWNHKRWDIVKIILSEENLWE